MRIVCAAIVFCLLASGQVKADDPALEAFLKKPNVEVGRDGKLPGAPIVRIRIQSTPPTPAEVVSLKSLEHLRLLDLPTPLLDATTLKALVSEGLLHKLPYAFGEGFSQPKNDAGVVHFRPLGARFGNDALQSLAGLKGLRELSLNSPGITDTGAAELARLDGLEELHLFMPVNDAMLVGLKGMNRLHSLTIGATAISDAGVSALKGLPALASVRVLQFNNDVFVKMGKANLIHLLSVATGENGGRAPDEAKVRAVNLSDSLLLPSGLEHLVHLTGLEVLYLPLSLRVTDSVMDTLVKLPTLRELTFFNGELTPQGWECVAKLANLRRLSISGTNLNDDALKRLRGLKEMRLLDLSRTKLTAQGIRAMADFPLAEQVSLLGVPVDAAGAEILAELPKLERLVLSHKTIGDTEIGKLVKCKVLRELDLTGTSVTAAGLKSLAPLNKTLRRLIVSGVDEARVIALSDANLLHTLPQFVAAKGNEVRTPDDVIEITDARADFTDECLRRMTAFKNVRRLDLSTSRLLTAACPKHVGVFEKLEWLDLARAPIANLKDLAGCPNLQTLRLSQTKVTGEALVDLAPLKKLDALMLDGCPVTDAGLKHLARLDSLRTLYLGGTQITDEGLKTLAGLKQLEFLSLLNVKVNPMAVAALRTALPGCQIIGPRGEK